MVAKLVAVMCVVACAAAVPVLQHEAHEEHYEPAHYEYQYSVHDTHTHDIKRQQEARQGDAVHGSYSLLQPDGLTRVVHYTADKEHGFNAVVTYEGHATETPHAPAAAPAQHAAAAPAPALHAYTHNLGHVSYSSPVSSYHH